MSLGMMVTRLAWIAHRLVSSEADQVRLGGLLQGDDGRRLEAEVGLEVWAISRTRRWKGSLRISSSVDFWYRRIRGAPRCPGGSGGAS